MEPFGKEKALIGMVHMLPTPLAPMSHGEWDIDSIIEKALEDARLLAENGADGILVENFNDKPFYPSEVPTHTLTAMTIVVHELVKEFDLPIGVNILRNACSQALGVAAVTGASFIRCNVLTGMMITNEGVFTGKAYEIDRYRHQLGKNTKIYADIFVKHAYSPVPIQEFENVAVDTLDRGGADALILTGKRTGLPLSVSMVTHIESLKKLRPDAKLIVGSGVNAKNIGHLRKYFNAFIVGSYFQKYDPRSKMFMIVPDRVKQIKKEISREG